MTERDAAFEEVAEVCDVRKRLALIPPSAQVRGLYFRSVEAVLTQAGHLERYRALFPERFSAIRWYPASELLVHLVVGGALLTGPTRVHEGMSEIGRRNAIAVADSLLGRALLRLLSRDPKRLLQQAVAGRRQTYNYGMWQLSFPTPRSAIMQMEQEYLYIDSYMLGAAQGTFDAINLPVKIEVALDGPYRGRHLLSW